MHMITHQHKSDYAKSVALARTPKLVEIDPPNILDRDVKLFSVIGPCSHVVRDAAHKRQVSCRHAFSYRSETHFAAPLGERKSQKGGTAFWEVESPEKQGLSFGTVFW